MTYPNGNIKILRSRGPWYVELLTITAPLGSAVSICAEGAQASLKEARAETQAGAEVEATGEHCLLACFPWFA